jgi:hypothetical protein
MGRLFIDGFENGSLDLWDVVLLNGSYPQIATAQKETGAYSCYFGAAASLYIRKNIAAISTIYFKLHVYITAHNLNTSLITFFNSVGSQITLRRNSDLTVSVVRGDFTGTVLATGTRSVPDNQWVLLEGKLVIADSGGVAQIKVDGLLDIDFTGDTRQQTSDALITNVRLGNPTGSNGNLFYVDNVVLDDASWIGNTKIQAISPTGAGNSSQWTPSAGSNWDCVEEVPANDADFVSVNAVDQVDLYAAANLAGTIGAVKSVQVQARCLKEGGPTPQNLKLACRTGGTNYFGGDNPVPTAAMSVFKLWETNPNTSAAWTAQEVNDLEIGVKSAA